MNRYLGGLSNRLTGAGFGIVLGEVGWAILAILLALATALFIPAGRRGEWVYFTSAIWALLAIVIKNFGDVWIVAGVALAGAVFLTAVMVRRITLNIQRPRAHA